MGNLTSKLGQIFEKIIYFGNNTLFQRNLSQKITQYSYYEFACFKFAFSYMVYPDRNLAFIWAKINADFKLSKDRNKDAY